MSNHPKEIVRRVIIHNSHSYSHSKFGIVVPICNTSSRCSTVELPSGECVHRLLLQRHHGQVIGGIMSSEGRIGPSRAKGFLAAGHVLSEEKMGCEPPQFSSGEPMENPRYCEGSFKEHAGWWQMLLIPLKVKEYIITLLFAVQSIRTKMKQKRSGCRCCQLSAGMHQHIIQLTLFNSIPEHPKTTIIDPVSKKQQ